MLVRHILWIGVGTWAVSWVLTPLIRKFAVSVGCVARPVQDRWGRRAVARLGGLSIALGFLPVVAWGVARDPRMGGLLLAGGLMLATGLVDDFRRLNPYTKLIAQIIAGCFVALTEVQVKTSIPWLTIPLTIGWLVLVMNAFNLMDNMDGLSAGIGAIAAGFCTWHAIQAQEWLIAAAAAGLTGSTLGFLRYNFPPAKIYMGDTGSQLLGLGLGTLTLMGANLESTHLLGILSLPTLLLAVPIFDTCFVTTQRIFHQRHPFQGGTDHLSHRLGILGLTTRQVVFTLYAISAAFGAVSILLAQQSPVVVAGIWGLTVSLFLLVGAYLARVRVYTGHTDTVILAEPRVTFIDTMLLHKQRILEVCIDFVLICASFVIAHALRFEANLTADLEALILKSLPWVIVAKIVSFFSCGLYQGVWRYTSLTDLVNIFRAVILGSVFSALAVLYLWRFEGYSRAVFFIDGLLLFVMVSGARVTERLLNEWITSSIGNAVPVLIVGAGDTGELLLRQLKLDLQNRRRVVGFIDDDAAKQGSRIHGVAVLGRRQDLGKLVAKHGVGEVLIAIRKAPVDLVQQIQGYCEENGIAWQLFGTVSPHPSKTPLTDP